MLTLIEFTKELSFLTLLKAKKYKVKYSVVVVEHFLTRTKRENIPQLFLTLLKLRFLLFQLGYYIKF